MKRWLVGALSLVISLFGPVGNLALQAQVNVNQTAEESAGADEKEEVALRISNSKRSRARGAKMPRLVDNKSTFGTLFLHHHEVSLLKIFTPPPNSSPVETRRQFLQVFRI